MPSLSYLGHHLEILIGRHWLGWGLLTALGVVCVGVLWSLLAVAVGARRSRPLAATTLAAALTAGLAAAQVTRTRRQLVELLVGERVDIEPSERARRMAEAISQSCETLIWTAVVLALTAAVVALGLVLKRPLTTHATVAATAALLFGASMVAVWLATAEFDRGFHCDHDCRYQALTDSLAQLKSGRCALAAIAGSSWLYLVLRPRQPAMSASPAPLARTSTAVLFLGVLSFAATRGMRWDAEHLVPRRALQLAECSMRAQLQATLPPAAPGCAARDAPVVELSPDGLFVDGTRLTRPEEATEAFRKKAELWRQLNPGRAFAGVFTVLAPMHAKPYELAPWLAAVHRAGFESFDIEMRAPRVSLHTKTLGSLHQESCCGRPVGVASAAKPLSQFASWDDVARATHGAALSVSLR